MKNNKPKLIEIARSFSFKLSLPHYQNADFFCSRKEEVVEGEEIETSERLYKFCKSEVEKSVEEYKLSIVPVEKKKVPAYKVKAAEQEEQVDAEQREDLKDKPF